jgi:hypothetical protein
MTKMRQRNKSRCRRSEHSTQIGACAQQSGRDEASNQTRGPPGARGIPLGDDAPAASPTLPILKASPFGFFLKPADGELISRTQPLRSASIEKAEIDRLGRNERSMRRDRSPLGARTGHKRCRLPAGQGGFRDGRTH